MFPVLQDHLDEAGAGGGQGGPGGAGQPLPDGPAGNGHIGMGRHPGRRRILSFPVEAQPPLLLPQEAAGQAFVAEEGHGRPGAGKEDLIVRFENGDGMIGEIGDLDRGGKPRAMTAGKVSTSRSQPTAARIRAAAVRPEALKARPPRMRSGRARTPWPA